MFVVPCAGVKLAWSPVAITGQRRGRMRPERGRAARAPSFTPGTSTTRPRSPAKTPSEPSRRGACPCGLEAGVGRATRERGGRTRGRVQPARALSPALVRACRRRGIHPCCGGRAQASCAASGRFRGEAPEDLPRTRARHSTRPSVAIPRHSGAEAATTRDPRARARRPTRAGEDPGDHPHPTRERRATRPQREIEEREAEDPHEHAADLREE